MAEQWVLVWSQQKNRVAVQRLDVHASQNRDAYAEDRAGDYRVIAVGSNAECWRAAENIRPTLQARAARFPAANDAQEPA